MSSEPNLTYEYQVTGASTDITAIGSQQVTPDRWVHPKFARIFK